MHLQLTYCAAEGRSDSRYRMFSVTLCVQQVCADQLCEQVRCAVPASWLLALLVSPFYERNAMVVHG